MQPRKSGTRTPTTAPDRPEPLLLRHVHHYMPCKHHRCKTTTALQQLGQQDVLSEIQDRTRVLRLPCRTGVVRSTMALQRLQLAMESSLDRVGRHCQEERTMIVKEDELRRSLGRRESQSFAHAVDDGEDLGLNIGIGQVLVRIVIDAVQTRDAGRSDGVEPWQGGDGVGPLRVCVGDALVIWNAGIVDDAAPVVAGLPLFEDFPFGRSDIQESLEG